MKSLGSAEAFGKAVADNLVVYFDFDQSGLGETPPDVGRAVRSLLGLTVGDESPVHPRDDDLYQIARDYLARFTRNDSSERSSQIFLAYFSSFFHEVRHVHDLLSTGFGQRLLTFNYNYYQNAPTMVAGLKRWRSANNDMPVPIPLSQTVSSLAGLDKDLRSLVDRYAGIRERLVHVGAPTSGIYSWMTATHLLEASATLTQLDMTYDVFGAEGVNLLWDMIDRSANSKKYIWLANEFMEIMAMQQHRHDGLGGLISYFVWAALQGNECSYAGRPERPSEVAYFIALTSQSRAAINSSADISWAQQQLSAFNNQWGFLSLDGAIRKQVTQLEHFQSRLLEVWKTQPELQQLLTSLYEAFGAGYNEMCRGILRDPETYFVGRRYAWGVLFGALPAVRIDFKVDGNTYTAFSRGEPALPPDVWDAVVSYSTMLRLLVEGRSSTELPHVEDKLFRFLQHEGLTFADKSDLFAF